MSQGLGTPTMRVFADAVLLKSFPLTKPVGTVHLETGRITIASPSISTPAIATGIANYVKFFDGNEKLQITIQIIQGDIPQLGYAVMDNTNVVQGEPITAPLIELGV